MKINTNISIDSFLKDKAQKAGLNISGLTEYAIREKLGKTQVEIPEALKCHDCDREGPKETAKTVNKDPHALTWLWPDEIWICNSCLKRKYMHVPVRQR